MWNSAKKLCICRCFYTHITSYYCNIIRTICIPNIKCEMICQCFDPKRDCVFLYGAWSETNLKQCVFSIPDFVDYEQGAHFWSKHVRINQLSKSMSGISRVCSCEILHSSFLLLLLLPLLPLIPLPLVK